MFVLEDMSKMQGGVCSCEYVYDAGRCLFLRIGLRCREVFALEISLRCREVFVLEDMSKMQGGVCS